jgi:hypothetical protein
MTTSMRTFRNAVLLAVGVMLVLVLADQGQASAGVRGAWVEGGAARTIYVTQVSPQDGATGVSRNANVTITFSEEIRPSTINGNTFKLENNYEQIPATFSQADGTGRTWVLDPYGSGTGRLRSLTRYTVTVTRSVQATGLGQDQGYLQSEKVWSFTTANVTVPYLTQVSPQDGATGVSRNANVRVTFSEEMDPSTVNTSTFQLHTYDTITYGWLYYTEPIPATVSKDLTDATGRTYLLDTYGATSSTLLSANRKYRVTVTTGVRDLQDGYPPPSEKKWYFTTGSS